ncbi:N-acetyltransferase family protein [Mycobacterium sp. CBMA271]|uniref:GNAT family N-acetyltransferase n=1 Tax=unclassified Mycobacteroides TaxID=2618759 RepID=UPI0012DEA0A5|nr:MULTISPECIES: GNAT family N-acetyltransferase [unclassified Mycobacteroides]MUM17274.1 GNAT family N-acetyltransferase [Mycobacteroides sp. CBMA 326]MUM23894.1 N-acetyltransferase family protein [Mycobacteroides sp. CBMA 271]
MVIRDATEADAASCAAIYAPYVTDTAISLEEVPPSDVVFAERIRTAAHRHAWLVAEDDGEILGYAYAVPWRSRTAYQWVCEVSVYVDGSRRQRGAGRQLYTALLDRLRELGYRTALAVVGTPNAASEKLHRSMGFEQVALYRRIGYKLGNWHDVAHFQLFLTSSDDDSAPGPPPGVS